MSNETIDMVSKGLWDRARTICITMMQGDVKRSRAERNFSMIQSVVRDGDTFRILALNKMSADILEREYAEDLKKSFLLAGAEPNVNIEFSFDENAKPAIIVPKPNTVVEKTKTGRIQTFISTMPLKEYYTFEEFVEGPSNSYVLAAAKGVASNPGQKGLNPLFIHGGTGLGKTKVDGTFVPGTGVTLVDNKYVPGANAGTALFIEVSEDQVNDWKFWCSFLFDEQFNDAYVDSGELIIARNTWGSHIAVLHDDNNNPIGVSDPLHQETGRTIREVGPVNLVKGDTLPSFRQAEVGQVFGIYGNLQNYTMNIQPGWPMSVVTWDDHENNAHKTKLSVTMDGRVTDKWGWVFLVKGASA